MKAAGDTFRENSRKNDKRKRQHPDGGGWRFGMRFYNALELATIVLFRERMGAEQMSGFF